MTAELSWLVRLARALLRDEDAAFDLAQEVSLAALSSGSVPIEPERRRAWLGRVARNLAFRRHRTVDRVRARERRAAREEALPGTADLVERAETAQRVAALVQKLDEPFRRALLLRFLEEREVRDIAVHDGVAEDTVRRRVRRGLELLREKLRLEERREGHSAERWRAALAPLAFGGVDPVRAGGVSAVTAASIGSFGGIMSMKWVMLAGVALVLTVFGVWFSMQPDPDRVETVAVEAEQEPQLEPADDPAVPAAVVARADVASVESREFTPPTTGVVAQPSAAIRGRVVDEGSVPVAGAKVFLRAEVEGGGAPVGEQEVREEESDADGQFVFSVDPDVDLDTVQTFELAAAANGYRRSFVRMEFIHEAPAGVIELVLARGSSVEGRVVDDLGRPIEGLRVLAVTADAGVAHVSPSKTLRRAATRLRGPETTGYEQCVATTRFDGSFALSGLRAGEFTLHSMDEDWEIREPTTASTDASNPVWRAEATYGVRVEVVDVADGVPVPEVRGRFHVWLSLADGRRVHHGKWVGKGDGTVTFRFSLDEMLLPADREDCANLEAVEFCGEVEAVGRRGQAVVAEWTSRSLSAAGRGPRIADVRVRLDLDAADAVAPEDAPTVPVELAIQHDGPSALDPDIVLEWRPADGSAERSESVRPRRIEPGRFELDLPAGIALDVSVRPNGASGSLPPWQTTVQPLSVGRRRTLDVRLPVGAIVELTRPVGWTGSWSVRAQYRESSDAEWFGAWNYGTSEDRLRLEAVRAAEWKFQIGRREGVWSETRIGVVAPGAHVILDS